MSETEYNEPIGRNGDVMTVQEFRDLCKEGTLTDYDGFGSVAKDGMMTREERITPSTRFNIPDDATHVVWFNC